MTNMTPALRQDAWRTADEAMGAVIATMRHLLETQGPVPQDLPNGTTTDHTQAAMEALDRIEDTWSGELSPIVWYRLVPSAHGEVTW